MADEDQNKPAPSIVIHGDVSQRDNGVIGSRSSTAYQQVNNYFFSSQGPDRWKHTRQFIALLSGLGLIATVITIATRKPELSDALYTFLRVTLALGAAAFAVCIDGFLQVRFKTWLRATGGLAVFVIVFFCQVAKPTSSRAGPTSAPNAVSAP